MYTITQFTQSMFIAWLEKHHEVEELWQEHDDVTFTTQFTESMFIVSLEKHVTEELWHEYEDVWDILATVSRNQPSYW